MWSMDTRNLYEWKQSSFVQVVVPFQAAGKTEVFTYDTFFPY